MKVTIRNVPKTIKLRTVRTVIDFCANELISKRLQNTIELLVEFGKRETGKDYGAIDYLGENPPREFTIYINPEKSRGDIIMTIAHEMCHMEQLAYGRWFLFSREQKSRWKNRIYRLDPKQVGDHNKPWEIEAYRVEEELINKMYKANKRKELE